MYVELTDKISKSAIDDKLPEDTMQVVVAREYFNFGTGLRDWYDDGTEQRNALDNAVAAGISFLRAGYKVCFTCAAGWSRSVTLACLVAALWDGTTFSEQFQKMYKLDPWISNPSPVRKLAEEMMPEFKERYVDVVQE